MGDLINLNRARKLASREQRAQQADENRARHGQTKQQRAHGEESRRRIDATLDQHRLRDNDAS